MAVLAVIPARLDATRLPRKPLRLLGGEPLVVRVYQRVIALGAADHCVVATDHPEVVDACALRGIPVVLTRTDHPSGTDRVAEVAARAEFAHFGILLNVQGDEPFVSAAALEGAVKMAGRPGGSIGTAAVPCGPEVLSRPDVVKVVCTDDGRALYFSRAPIPFLRDATEPELLVGQVRQHVGVYAYTRDALMEWVRLPPHPLELIERLEQLRPLAHGLTIGVADVPAAEGGIDTEDDLRRANTRWAISPPGLPS
jgi:3-deoxy-manno-octulosonate cytidylyltransferase (CMP-KDO synthetase)